MHSLSAYGSGFSREFVHHGRAQHGRLERMPRVTLQDGRAPSGWSARAHSACRRYGEHPVARSRHGSADGCDLPADRHDVVHGRRVMNGLCAAEIAPQLRLVWRGANYGAAPEREGGSAPHRPTMEDGFGGSFGDVKRTRNGGRARAAGRLGGGTNPGRPTRRALVATLRPRSARTSWVWS